MFDPASSILVDRFLVKASNKRTRLYDVALTDHGIYLK